LGQVDSGGIAVVEGLGVLEQWNDGISGLEESDLFLSDETSQILKLGHLSLFIPTIPPFHHSTIPPFHHSIIPSFQYPTLMRRFFAALILLPHSVRPAYSPRKSGFIALVFRLTADIGLKMLSPICV
jgi:hypothetical protein